MEVVVTGERGTDLGLDQVEFKSLVKARWRVSLLLTFAMIGSYFAFILCLALRKNWLATKFAGSTIPIGIFIGVGLILLAWVLTGIYVLWANRCYDNRVKALANSVTESESK